MNFKQWLLAVAATAAVLPSVTFASNGYLMPGYGAKAKGMGGVGVALPQDSIAAANNPAGMAWVGNRFDIGFDYQRQNGKLTTSSTSVKGTHSTDGILPEFGLNYMLNSKMSVGVSGYTNGMLKTKYKNALSSLGTSPAELSYSQWTLAPTFAVQLTENHAIGASVNLTTQKFKASGLELLDTAAKSSNKGNVTNKGMNHSYGVGFSLGWVGHITKSVDVGVSYRSPTWMGRLNKYKGLLADRGRANLPSIIAAGVAVHVTPELVVALDVEEVLWKGVKSFANSSTESAALLGAKKGPGFGWKNQTIGKIGAAYTINDMWTVRAGYNYGKTPIRSNDSVRNALTLATVEHHATAGLSCNWGANELNLFYMHGFAKKVKGTSAVAGSSSLKMAQDAAGLSYARKF